MGRIINPSEIKEQANIIIKTLQEENNHLLGTIKTLSRFIEEEGLAGNAWDSQKNRLTVLITLIKCIVCANHSIINDSRLLSVNCGDEELYEDELLEIIETCQNQINRCIYQIESNNDKLKNPIYAEFYKEYTHITINKFESIIYNYELIISEAKQKIERINEIEENLNNLFLDYKQFIHILKEIYSIITAVVDTINSFCNTGYTLLINQVWSIIYKLFKEKETFKKNITEQFGFNEETADIMCDVYEALIRKYPNASPKEIDWRFTRLMGGFVYDDFKWIDVAGYAIDVFKPQQFNFFIGAGCVLMNEKEYFVEYLEIDEADYKKLRYYVRLQHDILGDKGYYKLPEKIDQCESDVLDKIIKWKKSYEASTGTVCESNQEFLDIWNKNYNAFYNSGDFAHQMITTSTYLANDLNKDGVLSNIYFISDNSYVENKAGWLGDATLSPYSFPPSDYKADLDSVNIISYMDDYNMDFIVAYNKYYSDIAAGESRADIFLESIPLEKVKYEIYHHSFFFDDKILTDCDDMLYKNMLKDSRPDVYNFIVSLENGANEMEIQHEK